MRRSPCLLTIALLCTALTAMVACTPEQDGSPALDATTDDLVDMRMPQDMPRDQNVEQDTDMSTPDLADQVDQAIDMTQEEPPPVDMGPQDLELPPRPWDISKRGPYKVGYSRSTFSFISEPDAEERKIDVVFWYPTLDDRGKKARYMRDIIQLGDAYQDASIPDEPAAFPMLVFSHGNSSIAEQSYTFTEHFASHGWVVVAPYHQDNSIFDNVGSINYVSSVYRPQDISAMLDWTSALTPQEHPLAGHMDHDRIAMSGHSFGAFTTMAISGAQFDVDAVRSSCEEGTIKKSLCDIFTQNYEDLFNAGFHDPRVKVAMPQTPGIGKVFEDGVAQIQIPMMMMTARRDVQLPNDENGLYMWQRMSDGPHALFEMPNAGHFTYSNMCTLFGTLENASEDGCNETFIDADIALPIINHYGLAWAEYHLLGESRHEALISGMETPYSTNDLVYTTKASVE